MALLAPSLGYGTGSANFILGGKFLDGDDWEPIDDQFEVGVDIAFGGSDWPIWINVAGLVSGGEGDLPIEQVMEGSTSELALGINKTWTRRRFQPYAQGGIAFVTTDVDIREEGSPTQSDHDAAVGLYLGGGGHWRLGSHFQLGGTARLTLAEGDVFGNEFQGGGFHLGLTLGWGWPARKP